MAQNYIGLLGAGNPGSWMVTMNHCVFVTNTEPTFVSSLSTALPQIVKIPLVTDWLVTLEGNGMPHFL